MLLQEIKRAPIQRKSASTPRFHPSDMRKRFKKVGSGIGSGIVDSEVYVDTKHPNRVLKVVPIRNMNDPYYRFLRMIEQHQNNPFFPKIYGIKVYDTTNQLEYGTELYDIPHYYLYVFMERLQPITVLDPQHAYQLLDSLGIEYSGKLTDDLSLRSLLSNKMVRQYLRQTTVNPQFKQALRLLEPMIKHYGGDLHIDNFMIRLTGVGPQLVIVDPLYPDFGAIEEPEEIDWETFMKAQA